MSKLTDVLYYDETSPSGLKWKIKTRRALYPGDVAGCVGKSGYWDVRYKGKTYRAHRVVWELINGSINSGYQIDHINTVKTDNRVCNLRLATNSNNQCNRPKQRNNTSGYKGVSFHKSSKKWRSNIRINNKLIYLGSFTTKESASLAYTSASLKYHGTFARSEEV